MIWKQDISIESLNSRGRGSFSELLGMRFVSLTDNSVLAEMKVADQHMQPAGIMNGGVSCALAESAASAAANYCCEKGEIAVGLDLNTNHIRPAIKGDLLKIHAEPYHIGKTTQVWSIRIKKEDEQKLVSVSRLTLHVKATSA